MSEERGGDRRQFVQMGLAGLGTALAGGAVAQVAGAADQAATAVQPSFLCVYRPGPRWLPGKPLSEQPLREHGRYMLDLYKRGVMRLAGRFADGSGGAMLFGADDDAAAQAIVAADPAVVAQTFTYELRQWAFVDWEALAQRTPR
jgi:uncharacterized protein YciI